MKVTKMRFVCKLCEKDFRQNKDLLRHFRDFHPDADDADAPKAQPAGRKSKPKTADSEFCTLCDSWYASKKALRLHQRKKHTADASTDRESSMSRDSGSVSMHAKVSQNGFPCLENACLFVASKREVLISHIKEFHADAISETTHANQQEFETWKETVENESMSMFVKRHGDKVTSEGRTMTFVCHRSGTYKPKPEAKRRLKVQGSVKCGSHCPAFIRVRISNNSGEHRVTYFATHHGHAPEIQHITLRNEERQKIAGMLAAGISNEEVLNQIRDNLLPEVQRMQLLKRKDLANIKREFGLGSVCRKKDAMSVKVSTIVESLDKSSMALMQLLKEKSFDSLLKSKVGKLASQVVNLRKQHDLSLKMDERLISATDNNDEWLCQSATGSTEVYVLRVLKKPHPEALCQLHCRECGICVHDFSCTCADFSLRNTICKHVHLLSRFLTPSGSTVSVNEAAVREVSVGSEFASCSSASTKDEVDGNALHDADIADVVKKRPIDPKHALKMQCETILGKSLNLNNEDTQTVLQKLKQISKLIDAMNSHQKRAAPPLPLPVRGQIEPRNKLQDKQPRFYSRKSECGNKRKRTEDVSTPTQEKKRIVVLWGKAPTVLRKQNDHDYGLPQQQEHYAGQFSE